MKEEEENDLFICPDIIKNLDRISKYVFIYLRSAVMDLLSLQKTI
jgi:hypothetical protein